MIAGTKLAGKVMVTVRVDKDGDAMTKNPGDVTGQSKPVEPPAKKVVRHAGHGAVSEGRSSARSAGAARAVRASSWSAWSLSLVVGMVLAAHLDGPGGLLIATVVSGAGLLGAAVALAGAARLPDPARRRR